ncbi:MAG: Histidinol dehydrogenase [Firmicutes bacterium ADurb.Bin080]|jgi:histidinol dehydrogenase|nr:MAG: Histidinol dehydrogenase [Firmicutes bacterium ADurb.Bin080]
MKIINTSKESIFDFLDMQREKVLTNNKNVENVVREILENVRKNKDKALKGYALKFDGTEEIKEYTGKDFKEAFTSLDEEFKDVLIKATERISAFHNEQIQKGIKITDEGSELGQIIRPLKRVGLYVPGGTASYPSSVLMNAIPAKIAGVEEIVIITPPSKNGVNLDILAAAYIAGVNSLYTVGGAHGIAALAYGTETIRKVDKIVGPGNIYVATAKKLVYGTCDIDMIAGPSEITIIADNKGRERFIAADLISQAEHDKLASAILVTDSEAVAKRTLEELKNQLSRLERAEITSKALEEYGVIIITKDIEESIEIANYISPEHLEIMVEKPEVILERIYNAGSVFLGEYTPEPIGDYIAGSNHVLPTGGSARFFSPLSVESFTKKMQYISYSKSKFIEDSKSVIIFAEREGLTGHANSIRVRLE